jgi:hypothetical protein
MERAAPDVHVPSPLQGDAAAHDGDDVVLRAFSTTAPLPFDPGDDTAEDHDPFVLLRRGWQVI